MARSEGVQSGAAPATARRRVDGVLLVDKPPGPSSNAALGHVRRLYRADKAGHTGTLDPLASGLLPICFGEATKFAQALLEARKEYVATFRFGIATTTGDAEGAIALEAPVAFARDDLEGALARFVGRIEQMAPLHAALKYRGRNYYEYARAGVPIARATREVDIGALELLAWEPPFATLRIECGKGTYVRVLAEDLGVALGTCAHVAALRRVASGPFTLAGAATLDALQRLDAAARDARLLPVESLLGVLPRVDVDDESARALAQGRRVATALEAGRYRCHAPTGFVGVVAIAEGVIRPQRLLRTE